MDRSQLKWACRRGMLELDVLLGNFLDKKYDVSQDSVQKDFQQLLDCSDQDLFEWLTEKKPTPQQWQPIINVIIQHAKTRHHH